MRVASGRTSAWSCFTMTVSASSRAYSRAAPAGAAGLGTCCTPSCAGEKGRRSRNGERGAGGKQGGAKSPGAGRGAQKETWVLAFHG